jgi:ABC-type transport system involved in multi-copper enzyme maturation permease subunit
MDATLLHYRAWQGGLRHPFWGVWPVARTSLRMLLRRKLFWVLYAAALLLFLMFFFGSLLLDWAQTQVSGSSVQLGRLDTGRLVMLFRQGIRVLNGSQDTFGYFFLYQGAMVMVVLALAGSILVGNDHTFGSLPFYLAKPISRWHYVLGKCLAVAVVVNLLTTLPALGLYTQHAFDEWDYLTNPSYFRNDSSMLPGAPDPGPASWPLLLGILGYGLLLSVCLSLILVATATWMRRTMPLILVWTTLFLFLRLVSALLVDGLRYDEAWRLIDLWNNLRLLGCGLLQIEHERITPQPQPTFLEAGLVMGAVCLLCLAYLSLRTRLVEVVK